MRPESTVVAHDFLAMGTSCCLFAVDRPVSRLRAGELWVRRLAARLTRFSADSELSRLNAAAGEWMPISADFEAALRAALRASEMSAGLVNAGVLPALLAAGYTRSLADGPPSAALMQGQPPARLPEVLDVGRRRARVRPGAGIDLGGIAKGWMADRLCELIGPNAVVNLGGDLRAVGGGPRGQGWPVRMGEVTLMLRGHGAATSSVRRRRWAGGHHLIDPRTGLPAETGLEEVSVVAAGGFEAEVVAKTALLLGPNLAPAYCAAHAMAWWLDGRHDG